MCHVAEVQVLRWMLVVTRNDRNLIEFIKGSLGVAPIDRKINRKLRSSI